MRNFTAVIVLAFWAHFSAAAEPGSDRIVVIISLDGLAHFYLDDPKAEMPTLRALAAEGRPGGKDAGCVADGHLA